MRIVNHGEYACNYGDRIHVSMGYAFMYHLKGLVETTRYNTRYCMRMVQLFRVEFLRGVCTINLCIILLHDYLAILFNQGTDDDVVI